VKRIGTKTQIKNNKLRWERNLKTPLIPSFGFAQDRLCKRGRREKGEIGREGKGYRAVDLILPFLYNHPSKSNT
jgi:hypothetical protein